MLERGCHLLTNELLPLRGLYLRDEPVAHGEEHDDGDEHRRRLDDLAARRHRGEQSLEYDGRRQTRHEAEHEAEPDRAKPLAMTGLEEKRDDGADDEYRFEAFAQNDQEGLEECFPVV
jgi:hypothetical protein